MKELFRERDLARVTFYQSLLESAGIPTFIKNENVSTAEGVVIPEFFPALCVVNDEDYDKSVEMIQEHLRETKRRSRRRSSVRPAARFRPGISQTVGIAMRRCLPGARISF